MAPFPAAVEDWPQSCQSEAADRVDVISFPGRS